MPDDGPTELITVTLNTDEPAPQAVLDQLGLSDDEVDGEFGIIALDRPARQYALMVTPAAAARVRGRSEVRGPFANPRIEPFGPPEQ